MKFMSQVAPAIVCSLALVACGAGSDSVDGVGTVTSTVDRAATSSGDPRPTSNTDQSATTESTMADVGDSTIPTTQQQGIGDQDRAPSTFWAITNSGYELVQVDVDSGDRLANLGGWDTSGGCSPDNGCLDQAIDSVTVGPDGRLWVTDCCEPAVGNWYVLDPGERFDPMSAERGYGLDVSLSPDGGRSARGELGSVTIADQRGAALGRFPPEESDDPVWFRPLTWLDEHRLVVAEGARLVILDAAVAREPIVAREIDLSGQVWDAAVRADGLLVALVGWEETDLQGQVIDPDSGRLSTTFDLPDDAYEIDYDPSGTYLLVTTSTDLRWFGAGDEGTFGPGYVSASW